MKKRLIPSLVLALATTGCLVKETTHTLYLDPTGEVTWTVLERDIRSAADDSARRDAEEREYLEAFDRGEHGVELALHRLGGRVEATWLRRERPYTTMTEARFDSAADLAESLLAGLAIPGRVELTAAGGEYHLRLTLELADAGDDVLYEELLELYEDRESYRIVLTRGTFTAARGFELAESDTQAMLEEVSEEELESRGGVLELGLSWRPEG